MIVLTRERERLGLTRSKLGYKASVHPSRVGQIENGRLTPPDGSVELERLAEALGYEGDPAGLLEPAEAKAG